MRTGSLICLLVRKCLYVAISRGTPSTVNIGYPFRPSRRVPSCPVVSRRRRRPLSVCPSRRPSRRPSRPSSSVLCPSVHVRPVVVIRPLSARPRPSVVVVRPLSVRLKLEEEVLCVPARVLCVPARVLFLTDHCKSLGSVNILLVPARVLFLTDHRKSLGSVNYSMRAGTNASTNRVFSKSTYASAVYCQHARMSACMSACM